MPARPWWKDAVFYQIYPRSFADASGDGIGDLRGITAHLDHLVWLGVDALWLSPFYRSPMRDFGYDVSDHTDVDPLFGTLADFDALLAASHARGLKVIVDWVPAHTSSEHPWFVASRSSRDDPKRDWYVWRNAGPSGGPPNNWTSTFTAGAPTWTFDPATGQLYLHSFLPDQPDLDWSNPAVVQAMHDVLRFWLDRGVDGFRADVIHNIGKDPLLRDVPSAAAAIPHCVLNDEAVTHTHLREIRRLLDDHPGDRMMVGEVYLLDTSRVAAYYGRGDELHLAFNFPPLHAPWDAGAWRDAIQTTMAALDPIDAWPTWVLSNHDHPRHRTRYGSAAKARAAAVLLLCLRGTPFLYMGEELGLEDAVIPEGRAVDPGGRDGCRAPIPWDGTPGHGWPAEPWLPFPPDADHMNVVSATSDPGSMLHLHRLLLAARRASPALRRGDLALVDRDALPASVVGWERRADDDARLVLVNFESNGVVVDAGRGRTIEIASDGAGEGRIFQGALGPDQALVLR